MLSTNAGTFRKAPGASRCPRDLLAPDHQHRDRKGESRIDERLQPGHFHSPQAKPFESGKGIEISRQRGRDFLVPFVHRDRDATRRSHWQHLRRRFRRWRSVPHLCYNAGVNWEAINATAQIVSSVSVVASLWYLAVQVHRGTRVAKFTAQDAATTALREVTRPFAENPEVGRIWRAGLEISTPSRGREGALLSCRFSIPQSDGDHSPPLRLWINGRTGLARLEHLYRHYLATPGLEHYWRL